MPAHSETFPWPSYYGHFSFFENKIGSHSAVRSLIGLGDGLYGIQRHRHPPLRVFVCECYSFGYAELLEVITKLENLDAVVVSSAWCGYTVEVKRAGYDQKVGIYKVGDFMAALNRSEIWSYLNEAETELFEKNGWI